MDCREARPLLHPLLDGELGLERSVEVEAHLEACPGCAREYSGLRALRAALREKSVSRAAPAGLMERAMAKIEAGERKKSAPAAWRFSLVAPAFAAVAAFAAAFLLIRPPLPARPAADMVTEEVLSSHLRSLMANHLADVLSSDRHTVKPYFAGKLDFSPPVIDLASQGFPLVAGRLDYVDGHPVAALVYRRNKHIINLLVWPKADTVSAASEPVTVSRRGYQIVHWSGHGMEQWAASDLNAAELLQFAREIAGGGG